MPLPGRSAGCSRLPRWPLLAAWAVSAASLLAVALLPRPAAHAYGVFLLGGSAGALIVVLAYARLLRRGAPPPRTVLLPGGPWQGQVLLTGTGPMPEEVWLAGLEASVCGYRHRAGDRDRPQLRVLRYEPGDDGRPAAGHSPPAAPW
jgi:hypothetical protein